MAKDRAGVVDFIGPRDKQNSYMNLRLIFVSGVPALQVQKLAFDRWNFRHLQRWLLRAGFSDEDFVEFSPGVASMSPALRDLEQVLPGRQSCNTVSTRF